MKIITVIFIIICILYYLFKPYSFQEIIDTNSFKEPKLEETTLSPFFKNGCKISYKKYIEMNTRVLSITKYNNLIDSDLVPYDIVFGWNNMINHKYLNMINISQNNRWFFYNYKHNELFSENDIKQNFDNFHIIPENDYIILQIEDLSKGDTINVKGYLVDMECHLSGFNRYTSLSFFDRSSTSCEQILITEINKI